VIAFYSFFGSPVWLSGAVIDDFGNEVRFTVQRDTHSHLRAILFIESDQDI
jgi:hypothetical protein